jgi:hypothetical protein
MGNLIRQATKVWPETFRRTDHYGRYLYDISTECDVKGGIVIGTLPTGVHGIASLGAVWLICSDIPRDALPDVAVGTQSIN